MYFAVEKCGLVNQVERSFTKDEHDVIKLLFRKYDDNGHKIDWPHYTWYKRRKFLLVQRFCRKRLLFCNLDPLSF